MKYIILIVLTIILGYIFVQNSKRAEQEYQDCVKAGILSNETCWQKAYL